MSEHSVRVKVARPRQFVEKRRHNGSLDNLDVDALSEQYPSLKTLAGPPSKACEQAWVAVFTQNPDAMAHLIGDLIKSAYTKPGTIGQRKMPKEETVDLQALLHGDYTDDPIEIALLPLATISERAFCAKINMNRRTYQRIFLPKGDPLKKHLDAYELTIIAKAVNKAPSYFIEYRKIMVQAAFIQLLESSPIATTRLYKDYLSTGKRSPFTRP